MLYTDEAIKKRKQKERKIKNLINMAIYILLIPLLIYNMSLILQAVINPSKTPNFFGIKTYVIISGSMQPEFDIGDIVIVKNVEKEELQKGDIISFRQGQSIITHRIDEIVTVNEKTEYRTKGDNNNTADSGTITQELIEGKVINKIPNVGKLALLLQGKITIILIILFFYIYILHSGKVKKRKNQRRMKRINYEAKKEE